MIELACSGCTTGPVVHLNNNISTAIVTTPRDYLVIGREVSQTQRFSIPNRLDAAIQSSTYPTTSAQAIIDRVANNKQLVPNHPKSDLHALSNAQSTGPIVHQSQYTTDDFRACVTAIYLCAIITNGSWLNCNPLESLCTQYIQKQPTELDINDAGSYLNPSSIEAAREELIAFVGGGGKSEEQDDGHEIDKAPSNNHVKSTSRSATILGGNFQDGVNILAENHLDRNKTNKQPSNAIKRLKLTSKLAARRRHHPRITALVDQTKDQSYTSWIPRLLRNFNWDTLWVSSIDSNDEEMLADQPAESFETTELPEKEKFQILRPVDKNEPRNEINQTAFKLEQRPNLGVYEHEPNTMHQDEDVSISSQKAPMEVKTTPQLLPSEGLNKILNLDKEFELSASNVLDPFLQTRPQPSILTDKPQQQVLIPIRNECRCPLRPMDELPIECRFNKCSTPESSDLKNDATLGQSSVIKPPLEVSFLHYTRNQRQAEFLDLSNDSSADTRAISFELFNVSLPVKVVIHGFGSGGRKSWVQEMVYKILDYEDVNVIVVDWEKGAAMPHYVQAAGNTKLVGQRLAHLIQSLNAKFGMTPNNYHLIGFSLGAHVAGFAGAEIRNGTSTGSSQYLINRITGLDPASLLFEGYEPSERLDPTDALFVDVIHSNGDGVLRGGFGAIQELGHVDFYPNGGRVQVGCNSVLLSALSDIIYGKWQSLCNHRRALNFFMDSFEYSKCRFKSFNCDSYDSYLKGRGKMYLTTHEEAPFCANQFLIKITGTRGYKSHWGKVEVTLRTYDGRNESFWLSSSTVKEPNGHLSSSSFPQHNLQSLVVAHSPLVNFTQILLRYTKYKGWIYSGNESWSIDKVLITDSEGLMKSYCGYSTILQSHIISRIDLELGNCSVLLELPPEPTSSTFSPSKGNSQQKTGIHIANQDVQSRQTGSGVAQPSMTNVQKEPTLPIHQSHLASKLSIGYFPDRWQQQHRIRQQQITSFVSQFTTNNNMLQIKAI